MLSDMKIFKQLLRKSLNLIQGMEMMNQVLPLSMISSKRIVGDSMHFMQRACVHKGKACALTFQPPGIYASGWGIWTWGWKRYEFYRRNGSDFTFQPKQGLLKVEKIVREAPLYLRHFVNVLPSLPYDEPFILRQYRWEHTNP